MNHQNGFQEGLQTKRFIPQRAYNWNRKNASKQAIEVLIKHEIRFAVTGFQSSFKTSQQVEFRGEPIIKNLIGARGGLYSDVCFCLQVDGPCPLTKAAYKGQFGATVLTKSQMSSVTHLKCSVIVLSSSTVTLFCTLTLLFCISDSLDKASWSCLEISTRLSFI